MRTIVWTILIVVPLVLFFNLLERFSREGVDRVEIAWQGEPQGLRLLPGETQQIPQRGSFTVTAYWKDTAISRGVLTDVGMGLAYHSATSAKEVEVMALDRDHLSLFLINMDLKTQKAERNEFLRVERANGVYSFAYPK